MEEDQHIFALETSKVKKDQKFDQEPKLREGKSLDLEKSFSNTFRRAISISEAACKINISIYILMMGFGAVLILDSIVLSASGGVGLFSVILALLGVASLGSILLISPQSKITRNAAKSLQYQILYNGYANQLEVLKEPNTCEVERSIDDVERISLRLEQITLNTVDKIENINGIKPSSK
jgi:hypothetical protein